MNNGIDMERLGQELIAVRRDLHQYPETAWAEYRTTAKLIERLECEGIAVLYGRQIHADGLRQQAPDPQTDAQSVARAKRDGANARLVDSMAGGFTGCVAVIEGAKPGPTVVIRVDIDALNVTESTGTGHIPAEHGFSSCYDGKMHACGHDAHAAIGLGAALLLHKCREELCGRVKVIFQPAEEVIGGAASMVGAGLLDDCDYFFGGHVGLQLFETGVVAASCNGILATSKLHIKFYGKSAHSGKSPNEGCNALAAASCAVLNMLAIARHGDGASRVNVGILQAGSSRNVIPAYAEMHGETRGLTTEINAYMEESARRVCESAARMYGCSCEFNVTQRCGSADSSEALARFVLEQACNTNGIVRVEPTAYFGACEDVSYMMNRVHERGGKAVEMMFGTPVAAAHHNGAFDIDEASVPLTAKLLADLAIATAKECP